MRVDPKTPRSVHNDTDSDAILIMTSVKESAGDEEVGTVEDFWP